MSAKSKVLIIGGTGQIGKYIVDASAKAGHPTIAMVRESAASDPVKAQLIESFKNSGITIVYGDIYDHKTLVQTIKQVDVVISAMGPRNLLDQMNIISAIKEAGNVKRFLPSEFGGEVNNVHSIEPAASHFGNKAKIRKAIETEGIPYTLVFCNCFASYYLHSFAQLGATTPPRDKVVIYGDGNAKAIFVEEGDIGTYTIKAIDDPRTLNKKLYMRPPANICSLNEIVSSWEKRIGKSLEKNYLPEEEQLKKIQESPYPSNILLSLFHAILVKGMQTNFEIDPSNGVEASELYPEVKYITVDEFLDRLV
ncbi:eugenol synthase 1-like [Macadamia integrifolia]|uniref:eugenol synthase 1-like n=1 Tax=Macadamia integrifolia TaxID=60698 RepID=UPI001C5292AE|nr:eugenol synthase 1-like [Macadamia integrifolia]